MKSLTITKVEANQRIDKYLQKLLVNTSKSFIYKMIRKKNITLNQTKIKGSETVKEGDVIHLYFSDETYEKFTKRERGSINNKSSVKLDILFEDDDFLIVNKPVDMLSQPDGSDVISITQLINDYYHLHNKETTFVPGICNRLDRNTSGVILSGKNLSIVQQMNNEIREHKAKKVYHTIVKGVVKKPQLIETKHHKNQSLNKAVISNDKGKNDIKTYIEPIKGTDKITLLKVRIYSGKTHQIRAHLAYINHPIIGDYKYGDRAFNQYYKKIYGLEHQLLHAYEYDILGHQFIAPYNKLFNKIVRETLWDTGNQEG